MARSGRRGAAAFAQEALDDAILEAVEGYHRQPPAGAKAALGGAKAGLELVQFGIEVDADRLEGASRRVAFHAGVMAERLAHHRGKLGGAAQRARGDDRLR